ncbi:hypothetical protein Anapl_13961 [Anas platyrhynchos]|uniref:Uncharacterized protein n=1 Tax=Anas platyrhynchos TaxID=8839 RepID=R0LS45_ANAPL|nr:hypothetical protein Anapl_13961 [Anas platyrhynchos]
MTFPDIMQRKPDCDISRNVQVMAANFKAKKYSIKEGNDNDGTAGVIKLKRTANTLMCHFNLLFVVHLVTYRVKFRVQKKKKVSEIQRAEKSDWLELTLIYVMYEKQVPSDAQERTRSPCFSPNLLLIPSSRSSQDVACVLAQALCMQNILTSVIVEDCVLTSWLKLMLQLVMESEEWLTKGSGRQQALWMLVCNCGNCLKLPITECDAVPVSISLFLDHICHAPAVEKGYMPSNFLLICHPKAIHLKTQVLNIFFYCQPGCPFWNLELLDILEVVQAGRGTGEWGSRKAEDAVPELNEEVVFDYRKEPSVAMETKMPHKSQRVLGRDRKKPHQPGFNMLKGFAGNSSHVVSVGWQVSDFVSNLYPLTLQPKLKLPKTSFLDGTTDKISVKSGMGK